MRNEAPPQPGATIPPAPDAGPPRRTGERRWIGFLVALLALAVGAATLIAIRDRGATEAPPSSATVDIESIPGFLAFMVPKEDPRGGYPHDWDISVMSHEGTELAVTSGPEADMGPVLSPNGAWVAFARDEDADLRTRGDIDIWLAQVNGPGERRITKRPAKEVNPGWSPDGSALAFVRVTGPAEMGDTDSSIVIRDLGTGSERVLVPEGDWVDNPVWSPDGERIAFVRHSTGRGELLVMPSSGGEAEVLVPATDHLQFPAWSPDGTKIAYAADGVGGLDLFVVDVASGSSSPLIEAPEDDNWPAWSPDGAAIAFMRAVDASLRPEAGPHLGVGRQTIAFARADGSGVVTPFASGHTMAAPSFARVPGAPSEPPSDWPSLHEALRGLGGFENCEVADEDLGPELASYFCGDLRKRGARAYVGSVGEVADGVAKKQDLGFGGCSLYDNGQTWVVFITYPVDELSRAVYDAELLGTHVQGCGSSSRPPG